MPRYRHISRSLVTCNTKNSWNFLLRCRNLTQTLEKHCNLAQREFRGCFNEVSAHVLASRLAEDFRDFKIRDATASRTRRLIKDWYENAVVCAGKVKLRSPSRYKTTRLRIAFISVIPRHLFRRNSHGII